MRTAKALASDSFQGFFVDSVKAVQDLLIVVRPLPQIISLLMEICQTVFLQDLKLARWQNRATIKALPEQFPDCLTVCLDAGRESIRINIKICKID